MPDEPTAAVITGSDESGRSAVLGALLGLAGPVADRPAGGYLVVRYDPAGRGATARRPGLPVPDRPPRRVEVTFADPLLRHLTLVDTPPVDRLGVAGLRILADAAGRAGAAVHTLRSGDQIAEADVAVLTALVHAGVVVFPVLTPDAVGRWRGPARRRGRIQLPDSDDHADEAVELYRRAVAARVPALSDVAWHTADPPAADAAYLRQALTDWASAEAMRRAVDNLPLDGGTLALPVDAGTTPWRRRLDRVHRGSGYLVRHYLAIELAGLQLRCVQHFQRYHDPVGMLWMLDDELHALSLRADAVTDNTLHQMLDVVLDAVFAGVVPRGARGGLAAAVRDRVAADEITRALLVTPAGGVVTTPGRAAATALRVYPAQPDTQVVPGSGVALAGEWWNPTRVREVDEMVSYLERMVTELESALAAEVDRRFDAVRRALERVVGDAAAAGILAW
jgi:hypothetical protein